MKKRITALTLLLAMCMTLCAHAVEPRTWNDFTCRPIFSVSGTTATGKVTVRATDSTAKITITATLYADGSSLATWTTSGTGSATLNKSLTKDTISKGNCELKYTVTVRGSAGYDTVTDSVYG